jgi:hypothetical protein
MCGIDGESKTLVEASCQEMPVSFCLVLPMARDLDLSIYSQT